MTRAASTKDFHTDRFIPVTKDRFFAVIGQMNVNPLPVLATLKDRMNVSHWETPQREVVGRSIKDSWGALEAAYYLAPEYAS